MSGTASGIRCRANACPGNRGGFSRPGRTYLSCLRPTDVRGFARHVSNLDPRTEVPPVGVLPGWKRAKPYLYSDAQIDALLVATLALPPGGGLRRWRPAASFQGPSSVIGPSLENSPVSKSATRFTRGAPAAGYLVRPLSRTPASSRP